MPYTPTIHASTPAVVQGSTATTSTAPFTPPAGSWIVVLATADANNASTDERLTVSTTTPGVTFFCAVFLTGTPAASEIWAAYVGNSTSITVDVTDNKGAVAKRAVTRVYTNMGGIGATATVLSAMSISYNCTQENSLGVATGLSSNVLPAAGTGCTLIDETTGFDSGDSTWAVGRTVSLGTLPGTSVTLSATGPTGVRLVAAELLPVAASVPQQPLPPWLLVQIAQSRMPRGFAGGAQTIQGTATLTGAGSLTANAAVAATVTATGAGTLTANVVELATAALTGAGTLTVAATTLSTAATTGAGTLAATVVQPTVAVSTGAGTVAANVVLPTIATPTGAGSVTATVVRIATAALTGAGTATATATTGSSAALTAAGTLAALVTEIATAAPTGAGTVTAIGGPPGASAGTATLTGAGTLTANATVIAAGTLTGAGSLSTTTVTIAGVAATGAGSLAAAATTAATMLATSAGTLAANVTRIATVTATGAGALTATGTASGTTIQGTAALTGAGAVTALAAVQAGATLAGTGTLVAGARQLATAVLAGAGTLTAVQAPQASTGGHMDSTTFGLAALDAAGGGSGERESTRAVISLTDAPTAGSTVLDVGTLTVGRRE